MRPSYPYRKQIKKKNKEAQYSTNLIFKGEIEKKISIKKKEEKRPTSIRI